MRWWPAPRIGWRCNRGVRGAVGVFDRTVRSDICEGGWAVGVAVQNTAMKSLASRPTGANPVDIYRACMV
jgi:hypothetical protein